MLRLRLKVYYSIKPILPRWIVLFVRRSLARRRRQEFAKYWPIDERAGEVPPRWPGWPNGKRFAVVLTHDVEGAVGVQKIAALTDLERSLGFRSSFNLVPADSSVTPEVRKQIVSSGGEVGIHGWKHDGKLFFSRKTFESYTGRIRGVLSAWGAVGFRAPFMHRRLSWLHDLGLKYDSSTFDSDPFEPEPDGVQTIFPYWINGGKDKGYVELPYTVVQDFTLFEVLGEKTIDVWTKKVDWIADRGGMVLVNTHPDYMAFSESDRTAVYPAAYYRELLEYLRNRFGDSFWHALPGEVADYYREAMPSHARNSRKRICMVTYSNYETDNRVKRYAEALRARGDQVEVIAIETGDAPLGKRTVAKGVELITIQRRVHNERSPWSYFYRLTRFLIVASLMLRQRHIGGRYDLIHVHNIPDYMVFSSWYPKLYGAAVILDIHDIVPELFVSKFRTRMSGIVFRLLRAVEAASCAFADHVIIANHLWHQRLTARSVSPDRCTVFINHVDRSLFYQRKRTRTNDTKILLFHGSFQWHQGIEIAIEALPIIHREVGNVELHLYGGGAGGSRTRERLTQLAEYHGVGGSVRFFASVSLQEIPEIVVNADIGIVPKRADSFGNEAYSTKIMEFMSQGVPVVVSRTKVDNFYFDDSTVSFFESGQADDCARAVLELLGNRQLRERYVENGLKYVEKHCWENVEADYLTLIDGLHCGRERG